MILKIIKIFLLLLVIVALCVSCETKKNCGGMKYHNDDVKRGLAH
jgi:hypothetical protein